MSATSKTAPSEQPARRAPIWKSAGLHLTHKLENGTLAVSPDFLRAYYTRPEIHPIEESCAAEHQLFEKLMETPTAPISDAEIDAISDADTADNYRMLLAYRDHLLAAGSLESGYLGLFQDGAPRVPPVFYEQLVHVILSSLMTGEADPFVLRASEVFFRDQKVTTENGQLTLADAEVVEMYSQSRGMGGLGSLLAEAGTPMRDVTLDIMSEENAKGYLLRADHFNFALDFRFTQPGQDAFARIIERWVKHFFELPVRVQAMQSIADSRWSWHIGLDAVANQLLNALYNGESIDEGANARFVALFRMEILDQTRVVDTMRGKPVYLGLAMTPDHLVRCKPQNLLTNLPLIAFKN
ncbi:hypothetical protein FP2506_17909 [Fulvimarina pelagi HTCC2506]|uniref:Uncharacterized protein n=1 Tax=Fulvimarina pelagi HTCC2506 TaxID=314231 RepID=Q0G151_9HYPH|nr:DUF6352 family protein [Fulvimarina pelagi]EAU40788.1 hypothetical protein FP2506_17909 [Fulvimarina pelagi HTCC2506]